MTAAIENTNTITTLPSEVLVIVNPISGTRGKFGIGETVEARFRQMGIPYTTLYTEGPDDARKLATEAAAKGCPLVVVAGGDGTVNEVASALCGSETALGIIPCGSGNGLARTLEIPQTPDKAIDIILGGHSELCDCGTVNGRNFFCTFGIGFDAAVAHKFAGSGRRGKLTYIKNTLSEYLTYRPAPYALLIDGKVVVKEAFLIAVCNVSQYGNNVYIAPGASVTDGLLDITVIRAGRPVDTMMAGVGMLTGSFGPNKTIESFRVKEAQITRLEPGPVQLDGEPARMGTHLDIKCREKILRVMTPKVRHQFKPILTPIHSFFSDLGDDIRYILSGK